jgi:hypothetical protein
MRSAQSGFIQVELTLVCSFGALVGAVVSSALGHSPTLGACVGFFFIPVGHAMANIPREWIDWRRRRAAACQQLRDWLPPGDDRGRLFAQEAVLTSVELCGKPGSDLWEATHDERFLALGVDVVNKRLGVGGRAELLAFEREEVDSWRRGKAVEPPSASDLASRNFTVELVLEAPPRKPGDFVSRRIGLRAGSAAAAELLHAALESALGPPRARSAAQRQSQVLQEPFAPS